MKSKSVRFELLEKKLLYDNVLVRAVEVEKSDPDDILIDPLSYEQKPEIGEVVLVGEGRIFDNGTIVPMKVVVGDIVMFNKYASTKFRVGGLDYYVIREEDCIAH
mgnify:CR=1 FL=1